MTKEALKLALEALEDNHEEIVHNWALFDKNKNAIYAIKKALSQTEQEPVAWMSEDEREAFERFNETCEDGEEYDVPKTMMKRLAEIGVIHHTSRGIYGITKFGHFLVGKTTPPQRKPLLDEEINDIAKNYALNNPTTPLHFARAIESAHGIKETEK